MQKWSEYELYDRIGHTQQHIDNVFNYIAENPNSDPNAFEMNELLFEVSNIGAQGKLQKDYDFLKDEKYSKLRTDFWQMMDIRMEQLADKKQGLGGSKESPLYKYFNDALLRMSTLNSLGDEQVQDITSQACKIDLYVNQRIRDLKEASIDDECIYYNQPEFCSLLDKINTCKENGNTGLSLDAIKPLMEEIHLAYAKTPQQLKKAKEDLEQEDMSIE